MGTLEPASTIVDTMAATNHTMGPPAPQPPPDPNFVIEHSGTAEMVSLGQPAPHRVCCCCFITCGHGIAPNRARRCRLRHTLNSPSLFPFNAAASLFPTTRAPVSGGTCQAVNGLPHDGPTPRRGWVDTPSTILLNLPFARGGVRVKRGSCPAAGGTASTPLQARQPPPAHSSSISSVPATGPAMPAIQPSMVVLTTADPPTSKLEPPPPPLFPLQNTTRVSRKLYSSLHRGRLGR